MKKILENGEFFLGINYWASNNSINMWWDFDEDVIESDLAKLKEAGISVLRIFLTWPAFQPLRAIRSNNEIHEFRFGEEKLPDTEAGKAGVSEDACKKLERFCELADKYDLKLVVGLITGHMSFRYYAPEAFDGKNPVSDPLLLKWELKFVKYIVKRFKTQKSIIAWDLGNECNGFANESVNRYSAYTWASSISDAIRSIDNERMVVSGYDRSSISTFAPFNLIDTGEIVDVNTVHPYNIFSTPNYPVASMLPILDGPLSCQLYQGVSGKPCFIEEVGAIGYQICSEKSEADFYRALAFSSWSHNSNGVMWWCAFDQGQLDYAPYTINNIGSDYGFFRDDGSEKPVCTENREIAEFFKNFPTKSLPQHIKDAVCIVAKSENRQGTDLMYHSTFCLAKQANIDLEFSYAENPIPDAKLYIMPSVDSNRPIPKDRLTDLLEKVKNGASLYLSVGRGHFRKIPEITGVTFSQKDGFCSWENIKIGDEILSLKSDYDYTVESANAEILAETEGGRPVFFKNKYGKGYIYFSTIPVEKCLLDKKGVFTEETGADYSQWYRVLKQEITDEKVIDTSSKMLRGTEHIIDENSRYAVLINYMAKNISAKIMIKDGWEIAEIYRGDIRDGSAFVKPCDAVIIKLVRNH